jgi:hypothetical protein
VPWGCCSPAIFHTGIVVDDLTSAKQEFGSLLGITWIEGGGDVPMLLVDGPRLVKMTYAYSSKGPQGLAAERVADPTPGGTAVDREGPRAMVTKKASLDELPAVLEDRRGPCTECKVLIVAS